MLIIHIWLLCLGLITAVARIAAAEGVPVGIPGSG